MPSLLVVVFVLLAVTPPENTLPEAPLLSRVQNTTWVFSCLSHRLRLDIQEQSLIHQPNPSFAIEQASP